MNMREHYLHHIDLSVGDTVYYVTGSDAVYSVTKSKVARIETRKRGLRGGFDLDYTVYVTDDGTIISQGLRGHKDELDSQQVFRTRDEAIQFIVECLNKEINLQKNVLLNAQERLVAAERVLTIYEKELYK